MRSAAESHEPSSPGTYRAPRFEERMAPWVERFGFPGPSDEAAGTTAPLTISQEVSWYQAALTRDAPTYQEYDAVLIRGRLDPGAMVQAIDALARRHDAFRIVYSLVDGIPAMRYLERPSFPLRVFDRAAEAAADPRAFAHAYVRAAVRERFDLAAEPPARAHLVRLGEDLHLLVLVLFHIMKDGTTEGVLMRDISRLYAAAHLGEEAALPPLPTSLAEYARWQRRLAAAGAFEENVAYWTRALEGAAPAEVPADFPRPAILSDAGRRTYRRVPHAHVDALRRLAHAEGASLFVALLAGFALLIARWGGGDDVPIAFPTRNRADRFHPLVGDFINTLVVRVHCDGTPSFREVLRRARAVVAEGLAHQDAPFSQVVRRLGSQRRADQTPLAAALLLLRNPRIERLEIPGCTTERLEIDVGVAKSDLTLECEEFDEGMLLGLEYRTSLFAQPTAEALADAFATLCAAVAADPDAPVRAATLLSPQERARRSPWCGVPAVRVPGTLHGAIAAAARRAPEAVALVDGGRTLTYAQLIAAARSVAAALRASRAAPRTVALLADRSAEAVAGILGILAAGAAYLPIDPALPAARIDVLLEDGAADAVLASRAHARRTAMRVPVVVLEEAVARAAEDEDAGDGALAFEGDGEARSPAYVMYTSGSTGAPNGVVVGHAAVLNYLGAFRERCGVVPGDRVLQLSTLAFDISVEEIFGALTAGAALVVAPRGVANAAGALFDACSDAGVTLLDLPTAYFNEVVAALGARHGASFPGSIRLVVVGGENLTRERAAAFLAGTSNVRLVNGYGPTEAAVAVTLDDVTPALVARPGRLPLGRAIPNVRLSLVDDALEPVPPGAAGEIAIAGSALADGYRARPELEARRFPRLPATGERLYLTGDRGRLRSDGLIEFLGRNDAQAKVRGFRVEPGEVEAELLRDPRVRDAAVVVDDEGRLVACAVVREPVDEARLRDALAQRLPAFAVPERIAFAERLPLTVNGKRDRSELLRLIAAARPRRVAALQQIGPVELQLTRIWERVLGRADIGPHDDFFALGGHSLSCARMFTEIEAHFGRRLPLQTLFARPTIAALAAELESGETPSSLVTVHEPQRPGRPIFYLHGDFNGGGLYTQRLARLLPLDRPLYVIAPHGSIGDPIPPSIEAMADDYVRIVREAQPHGPYTVGGFCLGAL
ncbi:MAG: amino acid adenylation domain-containing protein, partial [Candidatus Eremiobacteraeota bacterium]|nr:amino acid adenylation domain-containing protein [Candidatus Eremiobacteraeota bacterium]